VPSVKNANFSAVAQSFRVRERHGRLARRKVGCERVGLFPNDQTERFILKLDAADDAQADRLEKSPPGVQKVDPDLLQGRGRAGAGFLSFLEPEENLSRRPEELEARQDDHQEESQAEQALDQ